jgi:hypothetical protein
MLKSGFSVYEWVKAAGGYDTRPTWSVPRKTYKAPKLSEAQKRAADERMRLFRDDDR